jgi:hypothetical protein
MILKLKKIPLQNYISFYSKQDFCDVKFSSKISCRQNISPLFIFNIFIHPIKYLQKSCPDSPIHLLPLCRIKNKHHF